MSEKDVPAQVIKRDTRRADLDNQVELELWSKYKREANTLESREALCRLLDRHDGMLRRLACKMAASFSRSGTFDDHLQNLRMGAMSSYSKYDPSKGTAVSTFAYKKAHSYAHDAARKNSRPINVSSHVLTEARALQSYFDGELDLLPDEKKRFEENHSLDSSEKIAIALEKYRMLAPLFLSLERGSTNLENDSFELEISDPRGLTEDEIIMKLDFERARLELSERANDVIRMSIEEECTDKEVAEALNITTSKVRVDLRKMKSVLPDLLQDYV